VESLDIPTLLSHLDCWEFWTFVSLAVVFFGVLFETVPEFVDFPKTESAKRRTGRVGGGPVGTTTGGR
jgi:hypothetical protein